MPQNRDILWKSLLEWIFWDLLCFLDPDFDRTIDLTHPVVFLDKELAVIVPKSEDKMTTRVVDKLIRVTLKEKGHILVHVEVQGQTQKKKRGLFGERMFRYFNLIFAKYACPVAAIVIYTGAV